MHFQGIQVSKVKCGTHNDRTSMYDRLYYFITHCCDDNSIKFTYEENAKSQKIWLLSKISFDIIVLSCEA